MLWFLLFHRLICMKDLIWFVSAIISYLHLIWLKNSLIFFFFSRNNHDFRGCKNIKPSEMQITEINLKFHFTSILGQLQQTINSYQWNKKWSTRLPVLGMGMHHWASWFCLQLGLVIYIWRKIFCNKTTKPLAYYREKINKVCLQNEPVHHGMNPTRCASCSTTLTMTAN